MPPGLAAWLLSVEQSAIALFVRDAVLLYPLANVLHVLAVLVFFAAVAVMDFSLLGWVRGAGVWTVVGRWRWVAIVAFLVILGTGSVLFVAEATAIAANPAFQTKAALIGVGLLNVWVMGIALNGAGQRVPFVARASALLSVLLWLTVAACGRFIAYV